MEKNHLKLFYSWMDLSKIFHPKHPGHILTWRPHCSPQRRRRVRGPVDLQAACLCPSQQMSCSLNLYIHKEIQTKWTSLSKPFKINILHYLSRHTMKIWLDGWKIAMTLVRIVSAITCVSWGRIRVGLVGDTWSNKVLN